MRMWGTPVEKMCRKHLLGEHVEMHMFAGTINKGISISGYIDKGLVNSALIQMRHDELAKEMINRGYYHRSPLPKINKSLSVIPLNLPNNLDNLKGRCLECSKLLTC
jgi:Pyrimidine dimer DNA glycosylase